MKATLRALAVVAGTIGLGVNAQAETWTAYTYLPSPTVEGSKALQDIAAQVSEITGGRITANFSVGGSMPIAGNTITQAVGDGIIHLADDGFFSGNVELGGIFGLPLLFQSWEEYEKGLEVVMPYLADAFLEQNVVVLGNYSWPEQVLFTNEKMTGLDDYKGLKIRPSSPEQAEFVRRMGGTPVSMSSAEVAAAMQTGVVNGVFTASVSGGRIWRDQINYNYRLPLNYFPSLIVMNQATFESLPSDEQDALKNYVVERTTAATKLNSEDEAGVTKEFADSGMTVTEPTQADFDAGLAAISSYWDEWAKSRSERTQQVLAEVRQVLGR